MSVHVECMRIECDGQKDGRRCPQTIVGYQSSSYIRWIAAGFGWTSVRVGEDQHWVDYCRDHAHLAPKP